EGHPSNPNLGNARGARESFRTAEGLWERVVRAQPRDPDARFGHAQARMALGDSYLFGARNDSAALYYGQAAATLDSLHAEAPDDAVVAGQLSNAAYRLAAIADSEGRLDDMVGWMQRGLAIDERNAEGLEPGAQADQRLANLVNSRRNVGYALGKVGRLEEALAVQRAAVRLADSLVDLPTAGPVTRSLRAYQYEQLGWRLLELDRLEEADIALSRAVDLAEANRREDPSNASATVAVGTAYEGRGQARIKADRWEEALSDHRRALALLEPQAEAWPSLGFIVSQIHREIGESLGALGRFEEAEAAHRSAFAGAEALLALDTAHVPARKVLAVSHFAYARLQRQRARAGVEPAAACAAARVAEDRARALWTALADAGQVFPGEALIWEDFEQRMPEGVCP
ncbi:MAG: hypothetical protein KC645_19565, partial [Gemmatimonadetes bacterium]|nr:hypothetical protein [Gemmatimonadota bacterium]